MLSKKDAMLTFFALLKQAGLTLAWLCVGAATGTATRTPTTRVAPADSPARLLEASKPALGAGAAAAAEEAVATMQAPVSCSWNSLLLGL